ncbi:hypothetical protein F511_45169 [Dorcoceras hygrometricum]|uniref:Uncharacterized protein n=1 Tax=Dorcoceras hygrometricum TaxID=472368 RepID=A0A2Z6ZWJ6_9LAMI|nr:hypothetical protein F511_45169 [Dorcoceras hygrometricum]
MAAGRRCVRRRPSLAHMSARGLRAGRASLAMSSARHCAIVGRCWAPCRAWISAVGRAMSRLLSCAGRAIGAMMAGLLRAAGCWASAAGCTRRLPCAHAGREIQSTVAGLLCCVRWRTMIDERSTLRGCCAQISWWRPRAGRRLAKLRQCRDG